MKGRSLSLLFTCIILISIFFGFFLGRKLIIESFSDLSIIILIIFLLMSLIIPWNNYKNIKSISGINKLKLKKITIFLIAINILIFIVFLITTITVMTFVTDINDFKYSTGVATDFYYKFLPFPPVFFNLAILFYCFSYFIFPLHFYYLYKKRYYLSFICFILSLNIVLYGLTFFSRAVVIQYILMYMSMTWLLYATLSEKVKKALRIFSIIVGAVSIIYFIDVSISRFKDDKSAAAKEYYNAIPVESITQDPVIYSYFDYTSQWIFNGFEVLKLYNYEGFNGEISYGAIANLADTFGIIDYNTKEYSDKRKKLWPRPYYYTFNGYAAYSVYDYGIIGSVIFSFIYIAGVNKMKPRNNTIKLRDLFLITLMIQIPALAIFYSQVGVIIVTFIIWVFLYIYLKYNIVK